MEYIALSNIVIQQIPTDKYPDRKKIIQFSFFHKYEGQSTWEQQTQTIKIVLPKNVPLKYTNWTIAPETGLPSFTKGVLFLSNQNGINSNLGGLDSEPILLCGDIITMNVGYRTYISGAENTYITGANGLPPLFKGFISAVKPKLPFTIECEDDMWLLKQMPTPAKQWKNGTTINEVIKTILNDSKSLPIIKRYNGYVDISVSDHSQTDLKFNVNNFTTQRGSLCALMARLRSEYRIYSYFRGDSLRVGYTTYVPEDTANHTFTFQKNIISDKLTWQRKDDLVLSMIVRSFYSVEAEGTTDDGHPKTKQASTEILIYNQAGVFNYVKKEKGQDFPTNYLKDIGERFDMHIYSPISDPKKLFDIGVEQLKKKYYDGFKGSFVTFAIPYVKHGDVVTLVNNVLPEMQGTYKVKGVEYNGGIDDGLRQEIFLDYRID